MQKALLIAEKPDLMRKIESVYECHRPDIPYGITFISQRGHLVTLKSPTEMDSDLGKWEWETLPIEPEEYGGWQYKLIEEPKVGKFLTAKERYQEIKKELDSGDYDFIIHAGDADQEGELLVNLVLKQARNTLPVKRFWTNDLTEKHILDTLKNLKDDDHDPMLTNLMDAAYARQRSDWRFGMNISRACTIKMNTRVSCGRVKTPILAIVVQRENEIRNFVPKTVYGVKTMYQENFDGTLFDQNITSNDENATEDQKNGVVWFDTKKEAQDVIDSLGKTAVVKECTEKRTETFAPKLYKLATIQIDAGKKGYNDKTTLNTIQKLYEHEYVSYPRTDCEYLSSNEDFDGILDALNDIPEFAPFTQKITGSDISKVRTSPRWINDKALEESGHSALRPTTKVPDLEELSKTERDIYEMICKRFIAIFLPPVVQDKVVLIAENKGKTFKSTGKRLVSRGYSEIFETVYSDTIIPKHEEGDVLKVEDFQLTEKTSVCPKRYTSPDLISVCENPLKFLDDKSLKALGKKLKIGTPATRSDIIRQLIDTDKYLEEITEKKTTYLVPTPIGEAIIKNLDGLQICRVDMTGLWEEQLTRIRNGSLSLDETERQMRQSVREMLNEIRSRGMKHIGKNGIQNVVGKCPSCGRDVIENDKGFYCSGYREGCKISVFKSSSGCEFTFEDYETLASGGTVAKNGDRKFYYDFDANRVMEESTATTIPCPCCPECLHETPAKYLCPACGFSVYKVVASHTITRKELEDLGTEAVTEYAEDFLSKSGKPFRARMVLEDGHVKFGFEDANTKETSLTCPCCKKEKIKEDDRKYSCSCGFTVWKTIAKKEIGKAEIRDIVENGETKKLDGFISKKGSEFSCKLVLNKRKKSVEMDFSESNSKG